MTALHPHETLLREAYAAFGRGDFDGYLSACTPDFTFHVAGTSVMAGTYPGREGLFQILDVVGRVCGASFREEVEDVLANDDHGAVLVRHTFERAGRPRGYESVHLYWIRGGKLAACWELPRDQAVFDAAWGPRD
jgi:ketosteroid isomerase-like protein